MIKVCKQETGKESLITWKKFDEDIILFCSKLQKILGLKEWHKDRAKEGRQLEIGTDKYRQYLVDLTPGEEFKSEQNKKREQQAERVSKMISKIIANRS